MLGSTPIAGGALSSAGHAGISAGTTYGSGVGSSAGSTSGSGSGTAITADEVGRPTYPLSVTLPVVRVTFRFFTYDGKPHRICEAATVKQAGIADVMVTES